MAEQLADLGPASSPYDEDFHGWCLGQADLLRAGRLGEVDLANVAEELEALGNDQPRALRSAYRELLVLLLKWHHQPARRSRRWAGMIVRERGNAAERLDGNKSLRQHQVRLFTEAYPGARRLAAAETGLPLATFPAECPFTPAQALDDDFWPDAVA